MQVVVLSTMVMGRAATVTWEPTTCLSKRVLLHLVAINCMVVEVL